MAEIREIKPGRYSNGTNQFVKAVCEFCDNDFFARKDRKGKNRFCGQDCFYQSVEKQNTFNLSNYQMDIINGCLLSDGCITKTARAKNFYFSHASTQESYSDFLISELQIPLHKNSKKAKVQNILGRNCNCSSSFEIRSPNSPTFTGLRSKWYQSKKIVPEDIELTPTCLLHWYLGDGTLNGDGGIVLCTDAFPVDGNALLVSKLNDLGFCSRIAHRNRIFIPNKRVYEFLKLIGPSPVECFAYKWDSPVIESYIGRKCRECGVSFDTEQNSRYFCNHNCYMRHWRKNGSTLRAAPTKGDGEEVRGSTA